MLYIYSLDGQVKLFDLRGSDIAATTWDLQPRSLSAFDVHPISGVFATYVAFFFLNLRARIILKKKKTFFAYTHTTLTVLQQSIMYLGDLNVSLFDP